MIDRIGPLSPIELSVTIGRYLDVEIGPCPDCGSIRDISEMKGGVIRYRCRVAGAAVMQRGGGQNEDFEHYRRSELVVSHHGDPAVVAALLQLRELRQAADEDMAVPAGAEFFPYGHEKGRCWHRLVHAGGDQWDQQDDMDFKHDESHRA